MPKSFLHSARRIGLGAALLTLCAVDSSVGAAENDSPKYIGPGSGAATSCHGSVKPVADSRILQNEYSTWIIKDKHSKAYQALSGDIGERMAKILKLGSKSEDAPKCLACHALYTTPAQRGRAFELAGGVFFEKCPCPSSIWFGRHTESHWTHKESVHA